MTVWAVIREVRAVKQRKREISNCGALRNEPAMTDDEFDEPDLVPEL